MDENKEELLKKSMDDIVDFAAVNGNKITTKEVLLYFEDMELDSSGLQSVFDYLKEKDITLIDSDTDNSAKNSKAYDADAINKNKNSGTDALDKNEYTDMDALNENEDADTDVNDIENYEEISRDISAEEAKFLEMYEEEIKDIKVPDLEQKLELISAMKDGNSSAMNTLVESYLPMVVKIAKTYQGLGAMLGDLVQEGNMALMLSMPEFETGDLDDFLKKRVTNAMENVIGLEAHSDRIGNHLADQLNRLDEVTSKLSGELGRVPTSEEIAKAMGINTDEVDILLKTSLNTLNAESRM